MSIVTRKVFIDSYEKYEITHMQEKIMISLDTVSDHLIMNNYIQSSSSDVAIAQISQLAELYDGRVLVISSEGQIAYDSSGHDGGKSISMSYIKPCLEGNTISQINNEREEMLIGIPVEEHSLSENTSHVIGVLLATFPIKNIHESAAVLNKKVRNIEMIILAVLFVAGAVIVSIMVRPIIMLTRTIENVASFEEGNISMSGYQETEGIISSFNSQRNRLQVLDDSRQEFVSNVSHELKTPIASMKVLADSLLLYEDAPIEMYKDFMADIVEEVDRENKIITDLLELVNMDKGKAGLNISQTDINDMIYLIIKRLSPIAGQNGVDIKFEPSAELFADVDEVKMTLAITNLVENGIKYNHKGGWVRIKAYADHSQMVISVSDSGCGIPQDAIAHIYERFYRVDKSHSKEIGGTGLGLPIARKIILLHRGSLVAESKVDKGTVFTVKVPLVQS